MPDPSLTPLEQILIRVDLDRPCFRYRDIRRLPAEKWQAILASGLVRETESAAVAECDCSYDVHDEDVWYTPAGSPAPGRPYLSCPEVGIVWLQPEELQQWTVDLAKLLQSLGDALSCAGRMEELVPGRLWLLGRTTVAGRTREVFFARQLTWPRESAEIVSRCSRFQSAIAPVLLVPQVVPRREAWNGEVPRALALTSLAALEADVLVVDRGYLESACREDGAVAPHVTPSPAPAPSPTPSPTPAFATPPGAAWSDVEIRFNDDHTVSVRVGEERGVYHYAQMGMADGRSTMPTEQWKLLRTFAEAPGNVLDWTSRDARRRNKKRCEYLVEDLRRFFGIAGGAPIAYSKRDKGWRALVRLSA